MPSLTVKGDIDKLTRHLRETQRRVIPAATVQALNEVARIARTEGTKEVAQKLKLPLGVVRNRSNVRGETKGDRVVFVRANRTTQTAKLLVYVRGIPVFQVAGMVTKKGVKAKGGRLYVGAFKAKDLVFKRRGEGRTPLMLPKISVQKALEQSFNERMNGSTGQRRFQEAFRKRLATAVARLR